MKIIFLISLGLIMYTYLFYPLILMVLSRVFPREWKKRETNQLVSIVVSVHNEERVIGDKLQNTLALNYSGTFEVFIASDASNDKTEEIVRGYDDPRVHLKPFSDRVGKTACLNGTVPETKGSIIVFTDANSMFPPNLLLRLTRHFSDPSVGLVTGWTKYGSSFGKTETAGLYARLEMWTKVGESRISSCVGADGAVFAIRKSLFRELRDDDINDLIIPLQVIKQGKRVVMDPKVFCLEKPTGRVKSEYRRQVRISTRTLRALFRSSEFLNPLKYGLFSYFLISHKLIRLMVPFFLIAAFVVNLLLANSACLFRVLLVGQIICYGAAVLSILSIYRGPLSRFLGFFLATTAAQLVGWFRMILGITDTTWVKQR